MVISYEIRETSLDLALIQRCVPSGISHENIKIYLFSTQEFDLS